MSHDAPKLLPPVLPDNPHDQELVELVHPAGWVNPEPRGRYDLVVVGAGTAGLVSALGAAGLGARVALVERFLMGGDCLNHGCVPSKGVLRSAHAAYDARTGADVGVTADAVSVDFAAVMDRMRRLRAGIAHHDSAERARELGVDVFLGDGRFVGPDAVEVSGKMLRFKKAVVATGARAAVPDVPGLGDAGYLTNETVFSLTTLPRRLLVVGAGPIGSELAQAFRRLGSKVTIVGREPQFLPREDPDAAAVLGAQFEKEGIRCILGANLLRVELRGEERVATIEHGGRTEEVACDHVLVGVGRVPNVEGLGLEAAGVEFGRDGVKVDDRLRTTNPRIFAAGDVASRFKFTHAADAMARIVIQNAFFFGRKRASALVIPWATYTDPEIAHVGISEREARERGATTLTVPFSEIDRAVLEGDAEGFGRIHVDAKGRLLGATVVSRNGGEMIGELALAITNGLGASSLSSTVHPYPTRSEIWRRLGDAYQRTRLTPRVKWLLQRIISWRR